MGESLSKVYAAMDQINAVVMGKSDIVKKVMATIIAGGHILLEDVPGVGKTTMAMAFSRALDLKHTRMQFTPDVLPSDVIGYNVPNANGGSDYREGAIMCNLFLADEINRTSPKTQSALLEVMEEGNVTVDAVTREVPKPFVVIATQNPAGSAGTQLLPESQLDRFMVRLSIGYPDLESEMDMLRSRMDNVSVKNVEQVISKTELEHIKEEVEDVFTSDDIISYIAKIAEATRNNPYIKHGISPRGSLALITMAKALAYLAGRDYVIPEDVRASSGAVMGHRIVLATRAKVENVSVIRILDGIFASVEAPGK